MKLALMFLVVGVLWMSALVDVGTTWANVILGCGVGLAVGTGMRRVRA